MRFITDRKQVLGLGSGREGTHHHWQMMISSMLMVPLVPLFVFTFANALGGTHEEVIAHFSRPYPAIITVLTLVVVVWHLMQETLVAIEDYVHGVPGKLALVATTALGYGLMIVGVFAIARMAL